MTAVPQPDRAGSELVARPAGVARSGRDRRHQSPRRRRTITAAFTDAEYAALATAARRVGLTPTGFCAQAALAAATAPPNAGRRAGDGADPRVEALAQLQVELAAPAYRGDPGRHEPQPGRRGPATPGARRRYGCGTWSSSVAAPWLRWTRRRRGCIGDWRDPEHHPRPTGAGSAVLPVGAGQEGGARRPAPGRRVGRRRRAGRPRTSRDRQPASGTSASWPSCWRSRSGPGGTHRANRCGTARYAPIRTTRS